MGLLMNKNIIKNIECVIIHHFVRRHNPPSCTNLSQGISNLLQRELSLTQPSHSVGHSLTLHVFNFAEKLDSFTVIEYSLLTHQLCTPSSAICFLTH